MDSMQNEYGLGVLPVKVSGRAVTSNVEWPVGGEARVYGTVRITGMPVAEGPPFFVVSAL